jgi:hypothetical protein
LSRWRKRGARQPRRCKGIAARDRSPDGNSKRTPDQGRAVRAELKILTRDARLDPRLANARNSEPFLYRWVTASSLTRRPRNDRPCDAFPPERVRLAGPGDDGRRLHGTWGPRTGWGRRHGVNIAFERMAPAVGDLGRRRGIRAVGQDRDDGKSITRRGATWTNRLPVAGLISFWARSSSSDENFGKIPMSGLHKVIRSNCMHNTP